VSLDLEPIKRHIEPFYGCPDCQVRELVAEVERLRERMREVAERLRVEADSGAPGHMVAVYAWLAVEHAIAGHAGDFGDCSPCHALLPSGRP
jgi:hypothetical protein